MPDPNLNHTYVDIKATAIKTLYAPCYKGLKIETFLEHGLQYPLVKDYFPDARDHHRLPRQWIINVIFTIVGEPVKDFVQKHIKERNDELAEKRHLMIELD